MEYSRKVTLKDGRTCIVRNGTPQDAEAVLAGYILAHDETEFLTTYADEITITPEEEREFLQARIESSREAEIVAEVGGRIVGAAGMDCRRKAEKTNHRATFGISIEKAWWGLGIGKALTEVCIECARAAGYLQMELEVVADNERAVRLDRSAGFTEYGRNPRGFRTRSGKWQENILMRLELDG